MSDTNKNPENFREPGLKHLRTTSLFRAVNFELFVKPNKYVMGVGIAAISFCTAYLVYLNIRTDDRKVYTAISEDGSRALELRTSKWE